MKEEHGFMIVSKNGVLQHGTYTNEEQDSIDLFIQQDYDVTGIEETWEFFQNQGFKVIPVKVGTDAV